MTSGPCLPVPRPDELEGVTGGLSVSKRGLCTEQAYQSLDFIGVTREENASSKLVTRFN